MKAFVRALSVVLVFWCAVAVAQQETGLITGTITDPSGAAISNAQITVKSVTTQAVRTATSSPTGAYTVTNLQPGMYDVTVTAQNFAELKRRVQVTVGSRNEVSLQLGVAGATTTVEVSAEPGGVEVQTQSSELSQVVGSAQITQLPTLTRNPYDLVGTAGNVAAEPNAFGDPRGAGFNINGQRASSTNILLDGGENVNAFTAQVGQAVPLDSVQEFRVITNDFSAEYGRASGGIVNVATRAGTNDFHGSAYEFNRISSLASNTYDNNANGIQKSRFTRNQFGYSVGGPVVKNKLFFFNSTEWTRVRSQGGLLYWVPSPELIAASNPATQDFFATFGQLSPNAQVLSSANAGQITASGAAGGPLWSALNPNLPALNLVSYSTNVDAGGGPPQNTYSTVARIDWNATDKTQIYGRYARLADNFFNGYVNTSPYTGYETGQTDLNQNAMLNVTHIWSPAVVTQTKLVYNRLTQQQPLGAVPASPTLYLAGGAPSISIGTRQSLLLPGYSAQTPGLALPFGGPQNVSEVIQDLSWTKGAHQLRFGGQYVYTQDNRTFGAGQEASGFYDFTGDSVAGFDGLLSGELSRFSVAIDPQGKFSCFKDLTGTTIPTAECSATPPINAPNFSRSNRFHDGAVYAQDAWKVTPRLTLNLGLRWEYFGVQHSKDPRLDSNFYLGSGSSIFEQIRNGFVTTADKSPVGGLWAPDKNNFAPRVGFAWDVFGDGRTAVRGGYGIAYERNFGNVTFNVIQNPPNYAVLDVRVPRDFSALPVPTDNFGPFAGATGVEVPLRSLTLRAVDPNIRTAYTQMWNFSVQREVARNSVLSLEYSGSHGLKQYTISGLNQSGFGPVYLGDDPNAGGGIAAFNRLNLQYGNINFRGNGGFNTYNGLNVRFATTNLLNSGLNLNTNYTWSHSIDNLSSTFSELNQNNNLGLLDPFQPGIDKASSDYDVRHRFVLSAVWELPWMRNDKGWKRQVLGGWDVAPIFTAQTGYPFTVYDCTNSSGDANCAYYVPSGPFSTKGNTDPRDTGGNNFDYLALPAAIHYANPLTGIGELPTCTGLFGQGCAFPTNMTRRNAFQQPGLWTMNLGVYKNFRITETVGLQMRGEFYNLFNHSNLYVQTGGPFNNGGAADVSAGTDAGYIIPAKRGSTPTTTGSLGERRFVQLGLRLTF